MPTTKIAKLRWCQEGAIESTSGAFTTRAYKANYPYDMNGSGGQPMGWDQWAALFNSYVVVSSKIKIYIEAINTNTVGMTLGVQLNDDDTLGYSAIADVIESRKGTFCQLGIPAAGSSKCKLKGSFNAKRFFNVTNIKDNWDRLGGLTQTTLIGDIASYILWWQSLDGTTTTGARIIVIIDLIVLYSEPRDMPVS